MSSISSSISISDVGGMGSAVSMISILDIAGTGNTTPITSTPNITKIKDPAAITNNITHTLNATSPAQGETNPCEDLRLAQPSRLIEQKDIQLEAPHDSNLSSTSCSLPPLPLVNFTCSFPTAVPPTVPHPVLTTVPTTFSTAVETTVDTTANATVNTEVPIEVLSAVANTVPITVDTTVSTTAENRADTTIDDFNLPPADDKRSFLSITVETTVDESNLPPADDKQPFPPTIVETTTVETTLDAIVDETDPPPTNDEKPSFPYTIYNFTKSGLVVSEISRVDVEEQYHNTMKIVGEACSKCPKCTSDNRVQDLIDTIIELRFPDLDSALFRDGILSDFGFDDYWNELMATKLEVRERYKKYENWYAKVWEDIEANNELPAISKAIEKEFGQSQDFRRILTRRQHPKSGWIKRESLLFVMRMRRIRGKLEQRSQTQEKQEMQTIETSAKKNRKTRDQEKRRKFREREDKVAAKLLHDTFEDVKRVAKETGKWEIMMARRESTAFKKVCTLEAVHSGWEEKFILLLFIDIQKFVSRVTSSEDRIEIRRKRSRNIHQGSNQGTAEMLA